VKQPQPPFPFAIRCVDVWKSFGVQPVIRDLNLAVRPGTIMALLGPSGSGKTTVLRLIAGLEIADRGRVEVSGQVVTGDGIFVSPERRRIGMVFQDYALFPHLTVEENVAYGLPRATRDRSRRVAELLGMIGLSGLQTRMAYELSGGEQQRVALARALAREPLVVLLDEPFSNLDAELRLQLREEMRGILRKTDATAIFVTHDQEEALFMGDQVAVMTEGHIVQVDTPERIFQSPRTRFVASFLGRADFLPAVVTASGLQFELGVLPHRAPLPEGTPVEILVRADDLYLAPGQGGVVVARTFRGTHVMYRVQLPSGRVLHSLQPHTALYPVGAKVSVMVESDHPLVCFPNGEAVVAEVPAPTSEVSGVNLLRS
jgi:iron(III) transport system ATP-binding protein